MIFILACVTQDAILYICKYIKACVLLVYCTDLPSKIQVGYSRESVGALSSSKFKSAIIPNRDQAKSVAKREAAWASDLLVREVRQKGRSALQLLTFGLNCTR